MRKKKKDSDLMKPEKLVVSYTVTVYFPSKGRYQGGDKVDSLRFKDERKARDYYTDMLLKYPNYNIEFLESE